MTEIKRFWKWATTGTWPNMDKLTPAEALAFYVSLYTQTYPGRTERLLNELLAPEQLGTEESSMSTSSERIDEYYEARANYDDLKQLSNTAERVMRNAEAKVVDALLDESSMGVKRNDGTFVSLRQHFSLSVNAENQESIREWLVSTEGDDSPFVEEKVNKVALTELIKSKMNDHSDLNTLEEDFPLFLNLSTRPGLSVRGWKTRTTNDD